MTIGNTNLLPYAVVFDPESSTSTIINRLYQPLVTLPGKWPSCDRSQAVAVDGPGNVYALEFVCLQIFELKTNGTYVTTAIDPPISEPIPIGKNAKPMYVPCWPGGASSAIYS